jgi:hypothetical protein
MSQGKLAQLLAGAAAVLLLAGCAAQQSPAKHLPEQKATASSSATARSEYEYHYNPVGVSAQCAADFKSAAELGAQDIGQANPPEDVPLHATATDCQTVDEWVSGAAAFPDAMGDPTAQTAVPFATRVADDLAGVCGTLPNDERAVAPLCVDATRFGLSKSLW